MSSSAGQDSGTSTHNFAVSPADLQRLGREDALRVQEIELERMRLKRKQAESIQQHAHTKYPRVGEFALHLNGNSNKTVYAPETSPPLNSRAIPASSMARPRAPLVFQGDAPDRPILVGEDRSTPLLAKRNIIKIPARRTSESAAIHRPEATRMHNVQVLNVPDTMGKMSASLPPGPIQSDQSPTGAPQDPLPELWAAHEGVRWAEVQRLTGGSSDTRALHTEGNDSASPSNLVSSTRRASSQHAPMGPIPPLPPKHAMSAAASHDASGMRDMRVNQGGNPVMSSSLLPNETTGMHEVKMKQERRDQSQQPRQPSASSPVIPASMSLSSAPRIEKRQVPQQPQISTSNINGVRTPHLMSAPYTSLSPGQMAASPNGQPTAWNYAAHPNRQNSAEPKSANSSDWRAPPSNAHVQMADTHTKAKLAKSPPVSSPLTPKVQLKVQSRLTSKVPELPLKSAFTRVPLPPHTESSRAMPPPSGFPTRPSYHNQHGPPGPKGQGVKTRALNPIATWSRAPPPARKCENCARTIPSDSQFPRCHTCIMQRWKARKAAVAAGEYAEGSYVDLNPPPSPSPSPPAEIIPSPPTVEAPTPIAAVATPPVDASSSAPVMMPSFPVTPGSTSIVVAPQPKAGIIRLPARRGSTLSSSLTTTPTRPVVAVEVTPTTEDVEMDTPQSKGDSTEEGEPDVSGWDSDLSVLTDLSSEGEGENKAAPSGLKIRIRLPQGFNGFPKDQGGAGNPERKVKRRRKADDENHPKSNVTHTLTAEVCPPGEIPEGMRVCSTRGCRHILPPDKAEYRWKMCQRCRERTRTGVRLRRGAIYSTRPNGDRVIVEYAEGSESEDVEYDSDAEYWYERRRREVKEEAENRALATGPPMGHRVCKNEPCGQLVNPEGRDPLCIGCRAKPQAQARASTPPKRREFLTRNGVKPPLKKPPKAKTPGEPPKKQTALSKITLADVHVQRAIGAEHRYPVFQHLHGALSVFKHRLDDFLDALTSYIQVGVMSTQDLESAGVQTVFGFDGEYSIVADIDIQHCMLEVKGRVKQVKATLSNALELKFDAGTTSILSSGGIATRYRCFHDVIIAVPVALPVDEPTPEGKEIPEHPPVLKRMTGELEIAVLPDPTHKYFPGQRTIVRFRLVG